MQFSYRTVAEPYNAHVRQDKLDCNDRLSMKYDEVNVA